MVEVEEKVEKCKQYLEADLDDSKVCNGINIIIEPSFVILDCGVIRAELNALRFSHRNISSFS